LAKGVAEGRIPAPNSRTAKRRAQWDVITAPNLGTCPSCSAPVRPHHVCGACGKYRGRQVLAVAAAPEAAE
jgi:large subunit ribosomal protein L32